MRHILAASLLVGVSWALVLVFALLWVGGTARVAEDSLAIRILETTGVVAIGGFALYHMVELFRDITKGG